MFVIRDKEGKFAKNRRHYSWMKIHFTYDIDRAKIFLRKEDAKQSRAYMDTKPTPEVVPVHIVICKSGQHSGQH